MPVIRTLVAVWLVIAGVPQVPAPVSVTPQPAAQYITAAFDTYPLVAFSEPGHGVAGTTEFLAALIRHPGFAGKVTDIVIECGNARYQDVADRYFAGEAGPGSRSSGRSGRTPPSSAASGSSRCTDEILADIRAFNLTLPAGARLRVRARRSAHRLDRRPRTRGRRHERLARCALRVGHRARGYEEGPPRAHLGRRRSHQPQGDLPRQPDPPARPALSTENAGGPRG